MGKLKTAAAVLLTAALLFAGACIPVLTAWLMDRHYTQTASLSPMTPVEFQIYRQLSSIEKLAMMSRIDSLLPILASKAKMTEEEVMDAVMDGLTPYMDMELVTYYDNRVEIQPYLVQVLDMPELQRVIWQVAVSGDDSDFTFFDIIIDDESGSILRINYTAENNQESFVRDDMMIVLADIFFSGLGIEDHWKFLVKDWKYAYIGEHASAFRFQFEDKQYGEITVDLFAHDYGFYIEYPGI